MSRITRGRVLSGELCAQSLQKLIYINADKVTSERFVNRIPYVQYSRNTKQTELYSNMELKSQICTCFLNPKVDTPLFAATVAAALQLYQ